MILRPVEAPTAAPFSLEVLRRLPLAESCYALWTYVATDKVLADLDDARAYPAADLLAAYLSRWPVENVLQQVTEVFALRHLIGSAPNATVFQAALCLVIYHVLQVVRADAAAGRPRPL